MKTYLLLGKRAYFQRAKNSFPESLTIEEFLLEINQPSGQREKTLLVAGSPYSEFIFEKTGKLSRKEIYLRFFEVPLLPESDFSTYSLRILRQREKESQIAVGAYFTEFTEKLAQEIFSLKNIEFVSFGHWLLERFPMFGSTPALLLFGDRMIFYEPSLFDPVYLRLRENFEDETEQESRNEESSEDLENRIQGILDEYRSKKGLADEPGLRIDLDSGEETDLFNAPTRKQKKGFQYFFYDLQSFRISKKWLVVLFFFLVGTIPLFFVFDFIKENQDLHRQIAILQNRKERPSREKESTSKDKGWAKFLSSVAEKLPEATWLTKVTFKGGEYFLEVRSLHENPEALENSLAGLENGKYQSEIFIPKKRKFLGSEYFVYEVRLEKKKR